MKRLFPTVFSLALVLALIVSFLPTQTQRAYAVSPDIVISQIYGGGGNSGTVPGVFTNDFVELFNLGTSTVSWPVGRSSIQAQREPAISVRATVTLRWRALWRGAVYLLVQEGSGR